VLPERAIGQPLADALANRPSHEALEMTRTARDPLTVLGVAGSLRAGSYNRGLIRAAAEVSPPGIRVVTYELDQVPLFNADVETEGDPPAVVEFKTAIAAVDALLIATPEYNHCVPGVLKNAVDWASRPPRRSVLTDKPVAIMGASSGRGATARAQAHLRDGLAYTGALVLPLPEVLVGVAGEKFDEAGELADQRTRQDIRDLLVALAAWTRRMQQSEDVATG
jgi:chromate reductase